MFCFSIIGIFTKVSTSLKQPKTFNNHNKPQQAVSKDTVARWIRQTMDKARLDNMFKPHSIRAACTSKAKKGGVPLQVIVKTAGWANAKVFSNHYDKPVKENSNTVQQAILEGTGELV